VEHCAQIEVELANVYSSGKALDSKLGIVYFPQRWNLEGIPGASDAPQSADELSVGRAQNDDRGI
jgi:hypothetical protein